MSTGIRFLHSADWQLGMRRHFLSEEALPRYRQARIDAIRTMARIATEQQCAFAVVCGDVFESNQIDKRTLHRALEALDTMPCPVYLLPGNHDPLDAGTIYRPSHFEGHAKIHVLASGDPVEAAPGVELVGAPWHTKRPRSDLAVGAVASLEPAAGLRVLVAHGEAGLTGSHDNLARIDTDALEAALRDGRLHYVALGDRHSVTCVSDRIWYSGTPEPTAFRESEPGFVLVVGLDASECTVERHAVGEWRFVERAWTLGTAADAETLYAWVDELPAKDRTVLRLRLAGSLSLKAKAQLDHALARAEEVFAGLEQRAEALAVLPDDLDLSELSLTGFARATVDTLSRQAQRDETARDALALLYRLAGGAGA